LANGEIEAKLTGRHHLEVANWSPMCSSGSISVQSAFSQRPCNKIAVVFPSILTSYCIHIHRPPSMSAEIAHLDSQMSTLRTGGETLGQMGANVGLCDQLSLHGRPIETRLACHRLAEKVDHQSRSLVTDRQARA